MEVDFGIEEFLGDRSQKVSCVMKELYSDFVVQEILVDQTVLRLSTPNEILAEVKAEEDKEADLSVDVPASVSPETLQLMDELNSKSKPKKIPTEGMSKEERTIVHQFVKDRYQGKLGTETKENCIEVVYIGVNARSRKRKRWNNTVPEHCHFTMAKENKDSSYALGVVTKFLNMAPGTFDTHGIKDRRAVTTQRVSCSRIEKERIMSLNSRLRDILVYDFEYKDDKVKMGGHWGNRFSIILRHLPTDCETFLTERLEHIKEHGFINYYGTQRFGSCGTNTATVGSLILQRNWEGAVRTILNSANLPGHLGTVGDALRCWNETGDAAQAMRHLKGSQSYASIEAAIFRNLTRGGTWQTCIIEALPSNMRSLYVHAYQSLLWNKVVSRRIREHGTTVCADDLGCDGMRLPENASIFDVHVPLPGVTTTLTRNYATDWYDEMLTADGLSPASFDSLTDRFALKESSRPMMILPANVEWKFMNHTEPRAYLQDGLSTKSIPESEQIGPLFAVQVKLSLSSGVYATVALRQITGTDMGKKNMKAMSSEANDGVSDKVLTDDGADFKPSVDQDCMVKSEDIPNQESEAVMKINLKFDGTKLQIEIDPSASTRKLKEEIGRAAGLTDFTIFHGEYELAIDETSLLALGMVSGDQIFVRSVDGGPLAITAPVTPVVTPIEPHAVDECMDEDEDSVPTDLRTRVVKAIRVFFEDNGFENRKLTSWESDSCSGGELHFNKLKPSKNLPRSADTISVLYNVLSSTNPTAIINVSRITDGSLKLLNSFTVLQAELHDSIEAGLNEALIQSQICAVTLSQICQIRITRNLLLSYLSPEDVGRLGRSNRIISSSLLSRDVDQCYWKRKYLSTFGSNDADRVSGKTYRQLYIEKTMKKRADDLASAKDRLRLEESLQESLRDNRFRPQPFPWAPTPGVPAPFGPTVPPGYPFYGPSPSHPGFLPHGPGNAPAPWDPQSGGELFGNRPPRFQGPRQLGPGPGHNPFNGFNRNDFM